MEGKESTELNRSLKILVSASFIVVITTILSKILTYLYRIIIARNYTPETYGVYSLSLMVVGWITVLAGLGFAGGLSRYIPYYRGKNEEYKSSVLVRKISLLLLISGILGMFIMLALSGFIANNLFHAPELESLLMIFSVAIPFTVLAGVFFTVLRSYEKIGWLSFIVNILQNSVKILVLIALILLGFGAKSIAFSYVAGIAIALTVAYMVSRRKVSILFRKQDKKSSSAKDKNLMKPLISYSWPLIIFGFMSSILSWTDTFMIGLLSTTENVGFYNAALPIALLITMSTDLFRQTLLPLITKEYGKKNMQAVKSISKQVTKWLLIAAIPIFTAIYLFPEEAIRIIFGPEYLPSTDALKVLSVGFFVTSVFFVSPEILLMKGKSKLILANTLVVVLLNLILNYFMINLYGITGAAISTSISLILLSFLFTYQSWKVSSIFVMKKDMLNVLLSGVLSFVLTLVASLYFGKDLFGALASGTVFIVAYPLALYLTKSIDLNDYSILAAIKGKALRKVHNKIDLID